MSKTRPQTKKKPRLVGELLETARDMRKSGLLTKAAHEKIAKRHADVAPAPRRRPQTRVHR
jgi:hypothetical protein